MGGGLIQLIAIGEQDQFLTGDPEITFFKSVYKIKFLVIYIVELEGFCAHIQ